MQYFAYKFRIYPTKEQEEILSRSFRTFNFIYNHYLAEQRDMDNMLRMYGLDTKAERNKYKAGKHPLNSVSLYFNAYAASKELTVLSKKPEYSFIKEMDSTARGSALNNLELAFANMRKMNSGYPKFKNGKSKSFTGSFNYAKDKLMAFKLERTGSAIDGDGDRTNFYCHMSIPKIVDIKAVIHREEFFENYADPSKLRLNTYTISKNPCGQYYISIQVKNMGYVPILPKELDQENTVGLDFGIVRPVTTSDPKDFEEGTYSDRFDLTKKNAEELARLNKIISHKMLKNPNYRTSNKYHRLRKKINNLHQKIKNQREHRQNIIVSKLVNDPAHEGFILNELKIKQLSVKNRKEKNSSLNSALLDVGIYGISTKLVSKSNAYGKTSIKVISVNTAIQCSVCGYSHPDNRPTQKLFLCQECGHTENADFNTSRNVKKNYFEGVGKTKNQ